MKWEYMPRLLKLYLNFPRRVQIYLARFGLHMVKKKKRAEMIEFMRH